MVQHIFAQATEAHRAGDLRRAEALYRQVLSLAPQHPDALHLLGRVALDGGNPQAAHTLIAEAVRQRPGIAEYQGGLAEAQRALGDLPAAVETYRRAVRRKPESADLQFGHGLALAAAGQGDLAAQALRRAIARDPSRAAPHGALGSVLLNNGQAAAAAEAFRTALRLEPSNAITEYNLGCALMAQAEWHAAETAFRNAHAAMPAHIPTIGNLARVLQDTGRLTEAETLLQQAVSMAPGESAAWLNLGLVRRALSDFPGAETAFRRAAALSPTQATLSCVGNALRDQGLLAESESIFLQALEHDSEYAEAHTGLAVTRMLSGDLAAGWPDFAYRGVAADIRASVQADIHAPVWRGENLAGKLLLYAEQGAGDFFQMARFAARAAKLSQGVVLRVPPELRRLAATIPGAQSVIVPGEACPGCAAICADLDLPSIFNVTLADAAITAPYLTADPAEIETWRARLQEIPGRKIGIAWSGNPSYFHDRQRSIPPDLLTALAGLENTSFISLQPGAAPPPAIDVTAGLTDFAATAALISALDLVISVDTAVAHLAGALMRPVWLLNRYAPDWRWLLARDDSPWYPTMRQFRQKTAGDWVGVIGRVRKALEESASF